MEETIRFEVEDKDGTPVMAEFALDDTKEVVELRMKGGKKVFAVDWIELRNVFKRTFQIWVISNEESK